MPFTKYGVANEAQGQLLAGIGASSPSVILKTGQGGLFPPALECPFFVKLEKYDTALNNFRVLKREIAICTNRSGDTLTITRAAGYCPADYAATTQTNTAFSFDADDTITQILVGEQIEEIQAAVEGKVDTVAGLRTGFGANKYVRVNRTTGAEESISIVAGTTPLSTDFVVFEKAGGTYELMPYSAIINDLSGANDRVLIAGEALALNDALYKEETLPYSATTTLAPRGLNQKMGDVSGNTRIELGKIIGRGGTSSAIKVMVRKVSAPTDNCLLRIETDDGTGKPSGTAVTNGTAFIAGTSITTGYVETSFNTGANYTLVDGTVYHLVAQRSGAVDGVNHYEFAHLSKNVRSFITNTHNGTVWGTPITTKQAYFEITNSYPAVFVKTNATNKDQIGFEGFAKAAAAIGATVKVASSGLAKSFSGLTINKAYYLSNTAGAISTTEGTNKVAVGFSDSASSISIIPFPTGYQDATHWYTIDNIATINGTTYTKLLRITDYRYIRYSWTAGIYAYFYVNGVSQASGTSVLCKPGDEVVMIYNSSGGGYPGSIVVETSVIKNIGIPITV